MDNSQPQVHQNGDGEVRISLYTFCIKHRFFFFKQIF